MYNEVKKYYTEREIKKLQSLIILAVCLILIGVVSLASCMAKPAHAQMSTAVKIALINAMFLNADASKPSQPKGYKLSEHFNSREFACKHCGETKVNIDLVAKLEVLREMLGSPIVITSGYRCPIHNQSVGGAKNSQHMYGNAVDIKVKGYTPQEVADSAKQCGFTWTKVYSTWTHVDVR